ncbi:F-box domain [Arabidopsis suecica]|uniref:F-box domain n=1 Tax=Arabidopsis suecica TaxID=45249 RepID=A0A8T2A2T1_ARASU|nr:F-box domain [Arabidopsis suecica]
MDSGSPPVDIISTLSDCLLVLIISFLPFKDALKTSMLSKRWRYLYREVRNISFRESEMVTFAGNHIDQYYQRAQLVAYMVGWVDNFTGGVIESFELCLSNSYSFEQSVTRLIEFAVSKNVKHLILDLSERSWRVRDDAVALERGLIQVPESFYKLTTLVTLKLFGCRFNPSRLANPGSVKILCFRWIRLENISALIAKAPFLETLIMKNCWEVGLEAITGFNDRVRKIVFKNCVFSVEKSTLDVPNIQIFKYFGNVHHFEFVSAIRGMDEAYLDFGEASDYNVGTGAQLCTLLYHLRSARTFTVCPYLLQVIQESEDSVRLKERMETRQLVLKSALEPNEFIGIRFMINSCPYLETLSFQMVDPRLIDMMVPQFDPEAYWVDNISHKCLKRTLKKVEVWSFSGGTYELHVLKYLIRYGRVLERVDLYLPIGLDEDQMHSARAAADTVGTEFEAASSNLNISLH